MYNEGQMVDKIDRKILEFMKEDCRLSRTDIADKLNISRQTVQNRVKALEEKGIILKYTIITNEKKLGKDITAFILIVLDRAKETWALTADHLTRRFDELEIIEMHHIVGDFDVILKMKTRNLDSLEYNILKIVNLPGVARTRTIIALNSYELGYSMYHSDSEITQTELLWNLV